MALEQTEQIKQQIIDHIENSFPEDKKFSAIEQIKAMDESELENFLMQNNLIKTSEDGEQQCIFCSIIEGKIPSYKIYENESAVAVLEINPISRGHALIIPKNHIQEISKEIQNFAKELSINLKEILSAPKGISSGVKEIHTEESEMFGHKILKMIPVYDDKTLKGKNQPAPKDILEDLQKEILEKIESKKQETKLKEEKPKEQEIITEENTWLPKRFP